MLDGFRKKREQDWGIKAMGMNSIRTSPLVFIPGATHLKNEQK
jgi:hypothetical protein